MNVISQSVRTRRQHAGPRNTAAICQAHIAANGARPSTVGLKGEDKKAAISAQKRWDAALFAKSPVVAMSIANDVCMLDGNGMLVPKRR